MRFMMFIYPKLQGNGGGGADNWMPTAEAVEAMTRYNEELAKAGVLLSLDGRHSHRRGGPGQFPSGKPR